MEKLELRVDPTQFGIEKENAFSLTKGLLVVFAERDQLINAYETTIKLPVSKENTAKFKDLRLKIRDNRTKGIETWHKNSKAFFLAGGRFCDAIKNLECAVNEEMEGKLEAAEKFFENQEKERIALLQKERAEKLKQYTEFIPEKLGELDEQMFNDYLNGVKLSFEQKQEALKKAEEERIAKEKAEKAEQERIRQENERLRKEAEAKELERKKEMERIEKEREAERKKQAEILEKQRKEAEEVAQIVKEKQAKIEAELKAKVEAERKEKERIEKELKARQEAEAKARKEAEAKARKEANAPEKEKLMSFAKLIENLQRPEMKTDEAIKIMNDVNTLLSKVVNFINEKAQSL